VSLLDEGKLETQAPQAPSIKRARLQSV